MDVYAIMIVNKGGGTINSYEKIQQVFQVLADGNRLKIVDTLSKECKSVNDIAEKAGISQPLASHHLKTLRKAGIVRLEKSKANFKYYCIVDETIWELLEKCKALVKNFEENKFE